MPKRSSVVARHRGLHHLDGAAGEAERHPHQRAGARPVDQVVRRGDEKALVGQLAVELAEERDRPRRSACRCSDR